MREAIKLYFISIMNDSRKGFFALVMKGILSFFACFYLAGVKLVDLSFRKGFRKQREVEIPVISIGNLTTGGTGKTPFTIFLTTLLREKGYNIAVITRGYGNDEHIMLKEKLPGVTIFVEPDRYKAAVMARKQGCDAVILDDGYQHRRLVRDLNVLLVDGSEGFGNEKLLPRGFLREPVSGVSRADMVIMTKCDKQSVAGLEEVEERLSAVEGERPVLRARHKIVKITNLDGKSLLPDVIVGRAVALISGIADPWYFECIIRRSRTRVLWHKKLTDHHHYTLAEIENLSAVEVFSEAELILTTDKDFVKLRELVPDKWRDRFYSVEIDMEMIKGKEALLAGLDSIGIG